MFVVILIKYVLDVTDVKYVINFDFPNNTEDYIHRIGRTARAENTGTAYTFFTTQVQYMYVFDYVPHSSCT